MWCNGKMRDKREPLSSQPPEIAFQSFAHVGGMADAE